MTIVAAKSRQSGSGSPSSSSTRTRSEAARTQLVLEGGRRLAVDVLQDEQRRTHMADAGAFPLVAGLPVSASPVPTSAPSPVSART